MREITCTICCSKPAELPQGCNLSLLEQRLEQEIQASIKQGYRDFLSGVEMGLDLWAGEIVLSHREENPHIRLICFQPCETQTENWPLEWRTLHASTMEQSNEMHCLQFHHTDDCEERRNRIMVEYSSRLIAVWDRREEGNVAYAVFFARGNGLDIITIDPREYCKGE